MKRHPELCALMNQAHRAQRCATAPNSHMARAMQRRRQCGELVSPYPATFIEPEIWDALSTGERTLWIARAVAQIHQQWVFTDLTAASIYGLWINHRLNQACNIHIVQHRGQHGERAQSHLRHIYMNTPCDSRYDSLPVTCVAHTLISCGSRYPLTDVLPLVDSALRSGLIQRSELEKNIGSLNLPMRSRHLKRLLRMVTYANPLSENGGESMCRATMLELGFPIPRLQVPHRNPNNPRSPLRVDFEFTAIDGSTVAVEFDGEQKYADPAMTGGRSISETVHDERNREMALHQDGIDRLIRINFREMIRKQPMARKLINAGIPRTDFASN